MALLPLGVSSVWGGRVPPSRARYNAIDTHGNREGQNVSSVSPCDLRKKLQRRQVCRRPLPPPRTPHATGCAAGRVRGQCRSRSGRRPQSSAVPSHLESTVRSKVVSAPGNEPRESAIATLAFVSGAQSHTVLLGQSVSKGGPSAVTRGPCLNHLENRPGGGSSKIIYAGSLALGHSVNMQELSEPRDKDPPLWTAGVSGGDSGHDGLDDRG